MSPAPVRLLRAVSFVVCLGGGGCGGESPTVVSCASSLDCGEEARNPSTCPEQIDTWDTYALTFFAASCRSCHRDFIDYATVPAPGLRASISTQVSTGAMPPGGGDVTDEERQRIVAWLGCNAP
jgi:hypothetical protein